MHSTADVKAQTMPRRLSWWRHWLWAALFVLPAPSKACSMDIPFQILAEAGQLDAFSVMTSLEPPPSGAFILDGVVIGDGLSFRHIAGDGAGGALVCLDDNRVVYLSSEGEAATPARDSTGLIALALSSYGWIDALRYVRDDLETDRAAWDAYRTQWGLPNAPEYPEAAATILNTLGLSPLSDPFAALHLAVTNGSMPIRNENGPFGRFAR